MQQQQQFAKTANSYQFSCFDKNSSIRPHWNTFFHHSETMEVKIAYAFTVELHSCTTNGRKCTFLLLLLMMAGQHWRRTYCFIQSSHHDIFPTKFNAPYIIFMNKYCNFMQTAGIFFLCSTPVIQYVFFQ